MLDEIIARLAALPEKQREEVEKQAVEATKGMKWLPNPGPQTEAYFHPADVLLYGGQGGGGKSDLGLGLAYTAHKRSLIMRRKYANLGSLTERAIEINGSRDGFNGSPPPLMRTADGRFIQFAGNQHLGDEQDWQGQPFDFKCVGRGTPVLMGSGNWRAVESLEIGDLVQTLEGPRRVAKVFPRRFDEAVEVSLLDKSGRIVASQVQSKTHEILTSGGWVSHDTFGAPLHAGSFASILCRFGRRCDKSFGWIRQSLRSLLATPYAGLMRVEELRQWFSGRQSAPELFAFGAQAIRGSGSVASYGERQDARLLPLWSALVGPARRSVHSSACFSSRSTSSTRKRDDGFSTEYRGWPGRCWFGTRRYGEHARLSSDRHSVAEAALVYLPQPSGAERPIPKHSVNGDRGNTPIRTRHITEYVHPYTKETRSADLAEVAEYAFSFAPIGRTELFDIEVEGANHYITDGGFINKNCFDEATQFLELQVRFHIGWIRSTDAGQRCRALLATNPPVDSDGDWIIGMFRPWLDVTHPSPAKHGELRWYVTAPDGTDLEVEGPGPIELPGASGPSLPMSRSFIPAALKDNPYLIDTGYQAKLDGLPEPIRSAVRDGNFMAARADADYQVIPTQWIIEAQARWKPDGWKGLAMTACALDIGAGRDETVLSPRYGGWYAELQTVTGEAARDEAHAAGLVLRHRKDNCPVVVDVGGGFGGPTSLLFKENGIALQRFNGAEGSTARTKDGALTFVNKRAESWWRFREELDPNQQGGSAIALPPDPQLRSDLAAPTWKLTTRGIQIESKDEIRKRIGRSPDRGDSVVMALSEGSKAAARKARHSGSAPRVVMNAPGRRIAR